MSKPRSAIISSPIVRLAEREVHAVGDTCTHGQVSLSEGDVVGCDARVLAARLAVQPAARACRPAPPPSPPSRSYAVRLGDDAVVHRQPLPTSAQENQPHDRSGDPRPAR
ncbi:MAG: hypothetical protein V9F04_03925 [Dermatophilaceae bacterium]